MIILVDEQKLDGYSRKRSMTVRPQRGAVCVQPLLQDLFRGEPGNQQGTVPFDAGRLEGLRAGDTAVDRRVRFLHRPGRDREFRNLPELALIREAVLRPRLLNNL